MTATDWIAIAEEMGRNAAVTLCKHAPRPLTDEALAAALPLAARAALLTFDQVVDQIGGPDAVDTLAKIMTVAMLEALAEVRAAQHEVKH